MQHPTSAANDVVQVAGYINNLPATLFSIATVSRIMKHTPLLPTMLQVAPSLPVVESLPEAVRFGTILLFYT